MRELKENQNKVYRKRLKFLFEQEGQIYHCNEYRIPSARLILFAIIWEPFYMH